jgi:hypothetical protein
MFVAQMAVASTAAQHAKKIVRNAKKSGRKPVNIMLAWVGTVCIGACQMLHALDSPATDAQRAKFANTFDDTELVYGRI